MPVRKFDDALPKGRAKMNTQSKFGFDRDRCRIGSITELAGDDLQNVVGFKRIVPFARRDHHVWLFYV